MATLVYGTIDKIKGGKDSQDKSLVINGLEIYLPPACFCPASVGDVCYGMYVSFDGKNYFVVNGPNNQPQPGIPVIEIPVVEAHVKKTIMLSLQGTKYNSYLIDKIYKFFQEQTLRRLTLGSFQVTGATEAEVADSITLYVENFKIDREGGINNLVLLGLTPDQALKFLTWWRSKYILRRLYLLGLTKREIGECSDRGWGPIELCRQLTINPYVVEKVPFEKAVQIVQRYFLQLSGSDVECARIIRYVDNECEGDGDRSKGRGWTCFPMYMLSRIFPNLLQLQTLLKDVYRCKIRYNFLYLAHQAESEDLLNTLLRSQKLSPAIISPDSARILSSEQAKAVEMALSNTVSVITGPGGTGKTTTISTLCEELEFRGWSYMVSSFTGKAVARIKQVLKRAGNAMTLHMILSRFIPIPEGVRYLIIDESSQVDNWLLAAVLKKIGPPLPPANTIANQVATRAQIGSRENFRLVLVGDYRQLQPFNGDLFNQIMDSPIPKAYLTEDRRRRDSESPLFKNMKALSEDHPELFEWGEDCLFVEGGIPEVLSIVSYLAQSNSGSDITVVCPYNPINDELNLALQEIFVPKEAPMILDYFGKIWKLGARVMMLVNRHDVGVMNGVEGKVVGISPSTASIRVQFSNNELVDLPTYPTILPKDDDLLEQPLSTKLIGLCWAVTPDKGQGSQWEKVVCYFPFSGRNNGFIHNKRGYTAMARAQGQLFVVSESETMVRQMFITPPAPRYDNLSSRLKDLPYKTEYVHPPMVG